MFESIVLFGLGMQEILVIALIVLLLFGGKKIPELMKGLGKGVKSFKEGMNEVTDMTKESGVRSQETGDRSQESGDKKDE
jgi:sec-independent protein translocase protein TatA